LSENEQVTNLTERATSLQPGGADRPIRGHVLHVDDQSFLTLGWVQSLLPDYKVLPISGLAELRTFLNGVAVGKHPPGPFNVVAALVDLNFQDAGGTGLSIVYALRENDKTRNVTPILLTNAVDHTGDDPDNLHAVLCAYANGGSILLANKTDSLSPRNPSDESYLQAVVEAAASFLKMGQRMPVRDAPNGFKVVQALRYANTRRARTDHCLVDLLLGTDGLQALWGHYMAANSDYAVAIAEVRDKYPDLNPQLRPGNSKVDPLVDRSELSEFIVAWSHNGGRLWDQPDGKLYKVEREDGGPSASRRPLFSGFARLYGRLLADPMTHDFADWHLAQHSS
jgi:hypothetical protein